MTRFIRNEETPPRPDLTAPEPGLRTAVVTRDHGGGYRIEETDPEPPAPALSYGGYLRVLEGRGTVCVPLSSTAEIPGPGFPSGLPPSQAPDRNGLLSSATNLSITEPDYRDHFGLEEGLSCELIPEEEIRRMWDQVLQDSNRQAARQTAEQAHAQEKEKTRKLEMLLRLALNAGNIDMAMLLFSGLESKKANEIASGLMSRMQQLQQERSRLTASVSQTGDQKQDAQNAQSVNAKVGDINTELNVLQTFLQDIQGRKNETQQMASNYLKSRHDTAMGIIRNMG